MYNKIKGSTFAALFFNHNTSMKKVLFVAAIACLAMGCCKKADKACEGECQAAPAEEVVVEEAAAEAPADSVVAEVVDSAAAEVVAE